MDGYDRLAATLVKDNPGPSLFEVKTSSSFASMRTCEALEVLGCEVEILPDRRSLSVTVPAGK